jgi:hypothetical protein
MSALLVWYARCSTDQQDLTAQRDGLLGLGVEGGLAACRAGDTLVVTELDRLARSLPGARATADELTTPSAVAVCWQSGRDLPQSRKRTPLARS